MSSLPGDDVLASARTTPTTVVDGDVVFSGVALLFVALGLAFVLYHYVKVHRLQGQRDAAAGTSLPSISARQHGAVGVGAAAASGVQGVDQVAQRALPVTLYNANSKDDFEDQELECAVCLGELYGGEAARFLPKCGHGFHAECVDLWLRSHPTCPLCRVDVDKQPDALLPLALLPPVLPEPANYGATQLPANVLFWGSQDDAATSARAVGGTGVVVIEVPETTSPSRAPREGDAAKSRGLARVKSIKRLWSRGRREVGASTGSSSTSFCHRASSSAHAEAGTGVADGNFEP